MWKRGKLSGLSRLNNISRDWCFWLFVIGVLSVRSGPIGMGWRRRTPLFEFLLFVNFMIHNEKSQRDWALGRVKFYLGRLEFFLLCGFGVELFLVLYDPVDNIFTC